MSSLVAMPNNLEDFEKEGLHPNPSTKEDGLRISTEKGNFEWWYFDAHLDDGTTIIVMFLTKYYARINVPLTPMVKLNITTPKGKTYSKWLNIPADTFSASKEGCDVKIGKHWIKGNLKNYIVHVDYDDIAVDLEFTRIVPS